MFFSDETLADPSLWLFESSHPDGHQHTGHTHGQESRLPTLDLKWSRCCIRIPAVPGFHNKTTEEETDTTADIDSAGVNRKHGRAQLRMVIIRQHRIGCGRGTGFTNTNPYPECCQHRKGLGKTRQGRHQTPEKQADRNQTTAHPDISKTSQRNPKDRVEDGKNSAVQKPHLGISDPEVRLNFLREN